MKILHVVPTYFPAVRYGGPIISVHGLCAAQASNGHDVSVYTTDVDGPHSLDVSTNSVVNLDGVKVRYFKANQRTSGWSRRLYRSQAMADALKASINEFDIVHLHSIYLWPTWFAARQAYRQNVPFVLSPRGMLVKDLIQQKSKWLKRAWLLLIERTNFKRSAAIHFTSERESQDAKDYITLRESDFILANGVDSLQPEIASCDKPQRSENVVLYLGRVNWKKGLERLISAIEKVPNARLIIAGNDDEGYADKLKEIIQTKKLQNRVELLGFVDGEVKFRLLSTAALLALCSDNENFGNVVLEAMSAATPVIVTPGVGASEVVKKYQAGLVCEASPAKLAENIAKMLNDAPLRQSLGANGYQAAQQHFSWQAIASTMVNHYESILRNLR